MRSPWPATGSGVSDHSGNRQIVDAYGQGEALFRTATHRVRSEPGQRPTSSKMTGTATVQKASFNFSGSRFSPVISHVNASVDHVERPLMTPDEIMRLRPPRKEGEGDTERIVEPGDMLIFTSGHFPILGMQMLYFSDPILSARAALAPPATLHSLEDGRCIPQKPVDRSRNVISRAETIELEDGLSGLERGFIEELQKDSRLNS